MAPSLGRSSPSRLRSSGPSGCCFGIAWGHWMWRPIASSWSTGLRLGRLLPPKPRSCMLASGRRCGAMLPTSALRSCACARSPPMRPSRTCEPAGLRLLTSLVMPPPTPMPSRGQRCTRTTRASTEWSAGPMRPCALRLLGLASWAACWVAPCPATRRPPPAISCSVVLRASGALGPPSMATMCRSAVAAATGALDAASRGAARAPFLSPAGLRARRDTCTRLQSLAATLGAPVAVAMVTECFVACIALAVARRGGLRSLAFVGLPRGITPPSRVGLGNLGGRPVGSRFGSPPAAGAFSFVRRNGRPDRLRGSAALQRSGRSGVRPALSGHGSARPHRSRTRQWRRPRTWCSGRRQPGCPRRRSALQPSLSGCEPRSERPVWRAVREHGWSSAVG